MASISSCRVKVRELMIEKAFSTSVTRFFCLPTGWRNSMVMVMSRVLCGLMRTQASLCVTSTGRSTFR